MRDFLVAALSSWEDFRCEVDVASGLLRESLRSTSQVNRLEEGAYWVIYESHLLAQGLELESFWLVFAVRKPLGHGHLNGDVMESYCWLFHFGTQSRLKPVS